jgi:hypothetical protein
MCSVYLVCLRLLREDNDCTWRNKLTGSGFKSYQKFHNLSSDHNIVQYLWSAGRQIELARLQKTPLDLLHSFIYDSTSRRYTLSFTMSSDPLLSYLGAVLGSILLPNAGSVARQWSFTSRCLVMDVLSVTILSRMRGSVTDNNGFWIGWLDFLTLLYKYNQL